MAREQFLKTDEVAKVFSVRPKTVRMWIGRGELRAVKLNRQWRVPASELSRLLESCRDAG
jgi:excisionase family DNA binding protein